MSLIDCTECKKQVSDLATSCPSCGAPINVSYEKNSKEKHLHTIQGTHKRLKFHQAFSCMVFFIGIIWLFASNGHLDSSGKNLGSVYAIIMICFGAIWYIITKIRIWWNHK